MLTAQNKNFMDAERMVSLPEIVRSNEPSVRSLSNENHQQLYDCVFSFAMNYLSVCYPNQLNLAPVIAADLIETRPSWKVADFPNLFKFLRQRQDIEQLRVMGNQITVPKFMELVCVYEEHRAIEMEKARKETPRSYEVSPEIAKRVKLPEYKPTGDEKLGKEMDRQREKSEREGYGRNTTPYQSHKDFFEKK